MVEEKKEYVITLDDGTEVAVSEKVFRAYKQLEWREKKRIQRERAFSDKLGGTRIVSLNKIVDAGGDIHVQVPTKSVEDIVEDTMLLELLEKGLASLDEEERQIIDYIYYAGKSEREYAREFDVPRKTLAYRKEKILKKLKVFYKSFAH